MIDLLVMTDGRDHIYETIPSAEAFLDGPISGRFIHDDSGDPDNGEKLRRVFPGWRVVQTAGRSGFGGAIRSAWAMLRASSSAPFVFHLEDDFTFRRIVPLLDMVAVLEVRPHLAQLALRRQPWNAAEVAAGGIVEQHPDDYVDASEWVPWRRGPFDEARPLLFLEHRRFFTTNPSLYRRSLILEHEWPEGHDSEGRFGFQLRDRDPDVTFGYWGSRDSGEWVHHIGNTRAGTGY